MPKRLLPLALASLFLPAAGLSPRARRRNRLLASVLKPYAGRDRILVRIGR
jgi:hypothetical protein